MSRDDELVVAKFLTCGDSYCVTRDAKVGKGDTLTYRIHREVHDSMGNLCWQQEACITREPQRDSSRDSESRAIVSVIEHLLAVVRFPPDIDTTALKER